MSLSKSLDGQILRSRSWLWLSQEALFKQPEHAAGQATAPSCDLAKLLVTLGELAGQCMELLDRWWCQGGALMLGETGFVEAQGGANRKSLTAVGQSSQAPKAA